jgi:O-methyltransferase involved in polyketide biosynthesis
MVPNDQPVELAGVAETLLMALYNRGSEAQRPNGLIDDPMAAGVLQRTPYPFRERFGRPDLMHPLRSLLFDAEVRRFLAEHPDGTVVALGEGLETQFWRVDDGRFRWLTVDLPEVIDLRGRLLPRDPRIRTWAGDARDPSWMEDIDPSRGVLVLAQGLLMYFREQDVFSLIRTCAERFPGGSMVFDTNPVWAQTEKGFRQSSSYTSPPMPWGMGSNQIGEIGAVDPAIATVTPLWLPRGRGVIFGLVYPLLRRVPGARAMLPMTVRVQFRG